MMEKFNLSNRVLAKLGKEGFSLLFGVEASDFKEFCKMSNKEIAKKLEVTFSLISGLKKVSKVPTKIFLEKIEIIKFYFLTYIALNPIN